MNIIEPDCIVCRGGCCDHNIKMFGLTIRDIKKLEVYNPVINYTVLDYPDLKHLYHHLISINALNGIYTLRFAPGDIDAIRLGACKCLLKGRCIIHDDLPGPCRRMDVGGRSCREIFYKRIEI